MEDKFFFDDDDEEQALFEKTDNDDENEVVEYAWADFNAWNLMNKTDRWDSRNYYPTEWELFVREKRE